MCRKCVSGGIEGSSDCGAFVIIAVDQVSNGLHLSEYLLYILLFLTAMPLIHRPSLDVSELFNIALGCKEWEWEFCMLFRAMLGFWRLECGGLSSGPHKLPVCLLNCFGLCGRRDGLLVQFRRNKACFPVQTSCAWILTPQIISCITTGKLLDESVA